MVGRTRLAFGGALVMAIVGAMVAMLMMAQAAPTSLGNANATATSATGLAGATTETALPSATASKVPILTEKPTQAPTLQVGQQMTLHGTIASMNSNGFLLQTSGAGIVTVVVDSQTTYQGAASSFSGLQQGMQADVTCVYQADGTFLAIHVSVEIDN